MSEGSYAIGSRCLVCLVSAIVGLAVFAWSVGVASSWGVGSGAGFGTTSSSVVGTWVGSGSVGHSASSVVGFLFVVSSRAWVVDSCSS